LILFLKGYFYTNLVGTLIGVSPTKVRKVPQDFWQLPERKGFAAILERPRLELVWSVSFGSLIPTES
jgi:hypothetical protein